MFLSSQLTHGCLVKSQGLKPSCSFRLSPHLMCIYVLCWGNIGTLSKASVFLLQSFSVWKKKFFFKIALLERWEIIVEEGLGSEERNAFILGLEIWKSKANSILPIFVMGTRLSCRCIPPGSLWLSPLLYIHIDDYWGKNMCCHLLNYALKCFILIFNYKSSSLRASRWCGN